MTRHVLGLFAIAMTTACADWGPQYCEGDWAAAPPEAAPPRGSARTVAQVLPVESTAIDILFVIDDSMSMKDEQAQLGIWSREMFDVLSASGELPDLHVAVTSSSVPIPEHVHDQCRTGAGGSFFVGGAMLRDAENKPARFIRDVAGPMGRVRNYSGTLTETFAKMALVGDSGCGLEQPFKAARTALSNKTEGFLRADALLLVVFVTDEDDCSTSSPYFYGETTGDACSGLGTFTSYRCFEFGVRCYDGKGSREFGERRNCQPDENALYMETVSGFAQFLKKLKANPAQIVVAGIYGKPNGVFAIRDEKITTHETPRLKDVCGRGGKEGTGATPAIRMNALMAEFGGRASQSSICESELSWAMRDAGLVARGAASRSHCLRGQLRDTDAVAAGIQPACHVLAVKDMGTSFETRDEVPFTVEIDTLCADTETHLAFRVPDSVAHDTLTVACDVDGVLE